MFSILLGLTPDNFTCHDESAVFGIQVVNQSVCILLCTGQYPLHNMSRGGGGGVSTEWVN